MKIINKINPRISAFKFKDEVRGFLINSLLKNEKICKRQILRLPLNLTPLL